MINSKIMYIYSAKSTGRQVSPKKYIFDGTYKTAKPINKVIKMYHYFYHYYLMYYVSVFYKIVLLGIFILLK